MVIRVVTDDAHLVRSRDNNTAAYTISSVNSPRRSGAIPRGSAGADCSHWKLAFEPMRESPRRHLERCEAESSPDACDDE